MYKSYASTALASRLVPLRAEGPGMAVLVRLSQQRLDVFLRLFVSTFTNMNVTDVTLLVDQI